ncbi:FTR1 family iron permease [Paenibacillus flagellatus]|uniref:Iron permease n=1 Tax=Paenibacillus flagellatus TaxID=2211139 RepID=A0A2V5K2F2_9BACL|nr:FTR1 family protein [Paenibacillus flagellatus]PYI53389.1 iron permease [Paenibacillus flagellatus]
MRNYLVSMAAAFLLLGALSASVFGAGDPAAPAEAVRSVQTDLSRAAAGLALDAEDAKAKLTRAERTYRGELAGAFASGGGSEAAARASEGFAAANEAASTGNEPGLAAAAAEIRTALLAGGYSLALESIARGDAGAAAGWLQLREYRPTSRFAQPNTDASLAIDEWTKGAASASDAAARVKADLLDAYQARLTKALQDAKDAEAKRFATRQAEHAASARGYFRILAPAYAEQRGDAAARKATAALDGLLAAALAGKPIGEPLAAVESELRGFRAAPLSLDEKKRLAGQLKRFASLVAVEYGRGVGGGKVLKDFEIVEASSFHTAALNAFQDLRETLEASNPSAAADIERLLNELKAILDAAAAQTSVAPASAVDEAVGKLSKAVTDAVPADWLAHSVAGDFDAVSALLDQMESAVQAGQYDRAESARLEAYAIMESGPEPRIVAFAPSFKPIIEGLFWNGVQPYKGLADLIARRASSEEIRGVRLQLDQELAKAQEAIGGGHSSRTAVAFNTATIVFREGLEAVLILAALMAGLQRGEYSHMRRPLWWGALGALGATVLTWFLARGVLASLARFGEHLEAIVSLIAVAVLLLITNWFFHKTYWTGWLQSFQKRKGRIVKGDIGQWIGMVTLGFTSIYREGFETVLFLQAMVLDAGPGAVGGGIALGMTGVVLVGLLLFLIQVKLPYKKMLVVTGVMIGSVLLTMVGTTTHVFQVVGWLPLHPIRSYEFPYWISLWFGVYATWEGIVLQIASFVFVVGSYYLARGLQRRGKREPVPAS